MSDFSVDLDALAELVDRLAAFERRAEALSDEVDTSVRRLHGEWSGPAAGEHLAAHRQWRHGAAEMRTAVSHLRGVVATARGNYGSAVAANARMWG